MAEGREDKRVALLAVAITGVVGITAPVVACATAKQSDQRLRIRLPPGSDVVEAYQDAGSHAEAVAYVMFNLVPRGNVSKVRRQLMQASRDYDRYIAAANRLVGSHLR